MAGFPGEAGFNPESIVFSATPTVVFSFQVFFRFEQMLVSSVAPERRSRS